MKITASLISAALMAASIHSPAQTLGEALRTPNIAVPVVNQTLAGTWLFELRRGGQPPTQPPVLLLIQFNPDGTINASAADGSQSSHHGVWLRVGDRKFLITIFLFSYNEARAFTTIVKVRGNVQLSADGETVKGTQEVAVMDRDGKVMATIPGGTFAGSRLAPEIPGDFYEFQRVP